MKNVFIVGGFSEYQFIEMYKNRGYKIVDHIVDADIVQFTGGSDVSPEYYGQHQHYTTSASRERDAEEKQAYDEAQALGLFCVGVCRGSQFLNVMNGGALYQHVDNHGVYGGHVAEDVLTGELFKVTSTHHQMMRMGPHAELLAVSAEVRSNKKLFMSNLDEHREECFTLGDVEVESVFYPRTNTFCYQPHPEIVSDSHPCCEWFFKKLGELV